MTDVEKAKADAKKAVADIGNKLAHAKADVKADAAKATADIENKMAHTKADAEKAKADIEKKLSDRKSTRLNSSHIPLSRMPSSA